MNHNLTRKQVYLAYGFPDARALNNELQINEELWKELVNAGYLPRKRRITPRQRDIIVQILGPPDVEFGKIKPS